jgi:hypothetical protein
MKENHLTSGGFDRLNLYYWLISPLSIVYSQHQLLATFQTETHMSSHLEKTAHSAAEKHIQSHETNITKQVFHKTRNT